MTDRPLSDAINKYRAEFAAVWTELGNARQWHDEECAALAAVADLLDDPDLRTRAAVDAANLIADTASWHRREIRRLAALIPTGQLVTAALSDYTTEVTTYDD